MADEACHAFTTLYNTKYGFTAGQMNIAAAKSAPAGAPNGLATEQVTFFRFKRLGNHHQHRDNEVSDKNTEQPLRHFQT